MTWAPSGASVFRSPRGPLPRGGVADAARVSRHERTIEHGLPLAVVETCLSVAHGAPTHTRRCARTIKATTKN